MLRILIMWVEILFASVDYNFFISILNVNKLLRKIVAAITWNYLASLFLRVIKGVLKWKLIINRILMSRYVSRKRFLSNVLIWFILFLISVSVSSFNDVFVPCLWGELFLGGSLACGDILNSIALKGLESNCWVNVGLLFSWGIETVEVIWSLTKAFAFLVGLRFEMTPNSDFLGLGIKLTNYGFLGTLQWLKSLGAHRFGNQGVVEVEFVVCHCF